LESGCRGWRYAVLTKRRACTCTYMQDLSGSNQPCRSRHSPLAQNNIHSMSISISLYLIYSFRATNRRGWMFKTIISLPRVLHTIKADECPRSFLPRRMINLIQDPIYTLLDRSRRLAQPVCVGTSIAHVGLYPSVPRSVSSLFKPKCQREQNSLPWMNWESDEPFVFDMNILRQPVQSRLARSIRGSIHRPVFHRPNTTNRTTHRHKSRQFTPLFPRLEERLHGME
jgi:hypothetical protein